MNHLKDISCQNNKNNNGNKLKRYVIRYQMEINNKLEKQDNGNKFNSKIIFNKIKHNLINNNNKINNNKEIKHNKSQLKNK